jgi:hypothetical protein
MERAVCTWLGITPDPERFVRILPLVHREDVIDIYVFVLDELDNDERWLPYLPIVEGELRARHILA